MELISFRIDRFDLLAVQGTLKSVLQDHNSKASVLWCLAFFTVQLSHPYMTTGKTIALTRQTFVGKIMYWTSLVDDPQYGGPLLYGDGCDWFDENNTLDRTSVV